MTITEFLLARIAEDEALARDAASEGSPPRTGWQLWTNKLSTTPGGERLGPRGTVEAHPNRVLAECEVKRWIVELHVCDPERGAIWDPACTVDGYGAAVPDDCPTLRFLASVYADHPDYREEWRL
jgi:hypothetical protein